MLIIVYKVQAEAALSQYTELPIVASTTASSGFHSTITFTLKAYITKVSSILKVSHPIALSQHTNTSHALVMP